MRNELKERLLRLERWSPRLIPARHAEGLAALDALLAESQFDPDEVLDGELFEGIAAVLDDVAAELRDGRLPASTAEILGRPEAQP